jgi:DNA-binding response OmpR family regulator
MPQKILIVDDEPLIRTLLSQALEDLTSVGVILLEADEGQEAWRIIQAEKPDLVILDVMIPGLSGYEVCKLIKSDPVLANTHIIILTAKGQTTDRQRGLEAGADQFILKPFHTEELVKDIAHRLKLDLSLP